MLKKPKPVNSSDDPEEFRATLIEHLDELRGRIMRSLILVVAGWVAGWYLEPWVYIAIDGPVTRAVKSRLPKGTIYQPMLPQAYDAFLIQLRLSFMIGVILAFPFVALQLWGFIAPGLKSLERRVIQTVAPVSVLLFAMGAFFCWLVVPSAFIWFVTYFDNFPGVALFQHAGDLVFFVLKMELAFGVGFQLPLVVFIIGKIGLLTPDTLMKNWRQATVAIFVIAMIVTPSNDPLTMLMMAIPLSILFIISVYALKWTAKDNTKTKKRRWGRRKPAETEGEDVE